MNQRTQKQEGDETLYLHGNLARIDQEDRAGHAYATNALTQYDIPTGKGFCQETDLSVEDAKRRVDENHK